MKNCIQAAVKRHFHGRVESEWEQTYLRAVLALLFSILTASSSHPGCLLNCLHDGRSIPPTTHPDNVRSEWQTVLKAADSDTYNTGQVSVLLCISHVSKHQLKLWAESFPTLQKDFKRVLAKLTDYCCLFTGLLHGLTNGCWSHFVCSLLSKDHLHFHQFSM